MKFIKDFSGHIYIVQRRKYFGHLFLWSSLINPEPKTYGWGISSGLLFLHGGRVKEGAGPGNQNKRYEHLKFASNHILPVCLYATLCFGIPHTKFTVSPPSGNSKSNGGIEKKSLAVWHEIVDLST